ncbi:hypothetical protein ON010_g7753 [Phytophthora cinnamomi]|nr:hypothetical protein ON010_g7753 [Phytophthora cinnamomi]
MEVRRLVICGDSNLVVRQVRGEIDYKAPKLTLLRQKAPDRLRTWPDHELLHVKRDWNGSANSLASAALQRQGGVVIEEEADRQDLCTLNRLDEILVVRSDDTVARISPVTTQSGARSRSRPAAMQEDVVRELGIDRIRQAQEEEVWIAGMKHIAADYELDGNDLLFYCAPSRRSETDHDGLMRLVVPETLHQDVLHHYHATLEGGHQGIERNYQRIRNNFHWRGLFRSVQRYVGECVDCETGEGRPTIRGESPGNIQATNPFLIIAMDHIPSLPKSYKGNTELLIWVDLSTRYVIAKASSSRTAQTIAESYEECVFRRLGTSEVLGGKAASSAAGERASSVVPANLGTVTSRERGLPLIWANYLVVVSNVDAIGARAGASLDAQGAAHVLHPAQGARAAVGEAGGAAAAALGRHGARAVRDAPRLPVAARGVCRGFLRHHDGPLRDAGRAAAAKGIDQSEIGTGLSRAGRRRRRGDGGRQTGAGAAGRTGGQEQEEAEAREAPDHRPTRDAEDHGRGRWTCGRSEDAGGH